MLDASGVRKLGVAPDGGQSHAPEAAELACPHAIERRLDPAVLPSTSVAFEDLSQGTRRQAEQLGGGLDGDPSRHFSATHRTAPCPHDEMRCRRRAMNHGRRPADAGRGWASPNCGVAAASVPSSRRVKGRHSVCLWEPHTACSAHMRARHPKAQRPGYQPSRGLRGPAGTRIMRRTLIRAPRPPRSGGAHSVQHRYAACAASRRLSRAAAQVLQAG